MKPIAADRRLHLAAAISLVLAAPPSPAAGSPIAPDEARPRVSAQHADKVIGKVAFVHGRVTSVQKKGRVTLLEFSNDFAAVIFADRRDSFPEDLTAAYVGKLVRVRGMVTTYSGNPQIALASADQLEILTDTPAEFLPTARTVGVGDVITIATFNILNLFDDLHDPYRNDNTTRPKPRGQLDRIANVTRSLDADVLALQEVENRGYLQRFVDVFLSDQGYREIVHYEGNDQRGIDVCLLSRIPVGAVTSYRHLTFPGNGGKPERFRRDLLCAELLPEKGDPFEVCVVHLKSNYDGRGHAEPIRVSEAKAIRRLLEQKLARRPSCLLILCGDFNDTADSETVKTLIGSGDPVMQSFAAEIPPDKRITYNREPYRSMIDFILASPAMGERYVPGSFKIHLGNVDATGSDHNPVLARFRSTNKK